MNGRFFRILMNFHRDPGSESGGGSVESSASTGAASAQPSGGADPAGGGPSTDGGVVSSPAAQTASASVDVAALESRFEAGETLTDAELEAYEAAVMAGKKPTDTGEPVQPEEPGDNEPAQGDEGDKGPTVTPEVDAAMKEVGAKSVAELPAKVKELRAQLSRQGQDVAQAKQMSNLLNDLAEGKPEAIAHFQKVSGKSFPVGQQQQAQTAQPAPVDKSLFIPQEVIDASLEPDVLNAFNARVAQAMQAMEAKLSPIIQKAQEAEQMAHVERSRSRVTDDFVELSSKFSDVYGVDGAAVRECVAQYVATGVVDPRIRSLVDTAQYMLSNNLPNLEAAHKILHFDKVKQSSVEREIAARRETAAKLTGAKPTVGLGGKANAGADYTTADLDAIAKGAKEAPAEWFTPEGIPIPSRMPERARKLYGV